MPLVSPSVKFCSPSGWPSGTFLLPANLQSMSTATAVSTSQVNSLTPINVPAATLCATICLWLVTAQAGAEARLGIYRDNNGVPGALVFDAGVIDLSTGSGSLKEATVNQWLPAGQYWLMCMMKAAASAVTVTRITNTQANFIPANSTMLFSTSAAWRVYTVTMAYGPLDTTCPAVTAENAGSFAVLALKAA